MKNLIYSIIIGLAITGLSFDYVKGVQADIENSVMRLHIIANSNEKYDQELKLKVRDRVIEYLSDKVNGAENVNQSKEIVQSELKNIEKIANDEIAQNGYNYNAAAYIGNFTFPTKNYENVSLPAGNYDALRVVIGEGKGENWWCIIFPQLCFNSAKGNLTDEGNEKLKNILTEDEYKIVTNGKTGKIPYKIKFKILEYFGK